MVRLLPLIMLVAGAACGGRSVDPAELATKLGAVNDRMCACKDMACVQATEQEHAPLAATVAEFKKDQETNSKFAALEVSFNDCVKQAMAAQGKQ